MRKQSELAQYPQKDQWTSRNDWTLLVYFAGDNNLTSEMVWGLQELQKTCARRKVGEKKIDVVAHFDVGGLRSRRYDFAKAASNSEESAAVSTPKEKKAARDLTLDGNLQETLVYTQRFIDTELHGREELTRMGRPGQKLSAFVLSQIRQLKRPAESYLIVLCGHGDGAEGDFLIDADPTTSLSIPELGIILQEARSHHYEQFFETPEGGKERRVKILGMDSCLMSNVEVCYEIRQSVDYLVASEGFVENTGWPYDRVVESLLSGDSVEKNERNVATNIARSYATFYRDYEIAGVSTDIAVCDLAKFRDNSLVPKLTALAASLIPGLEASHARRLGGIANGKTGEAKKEIDQLAKQIATALEDGELEELLQNGSREALRILTTGKVPHEDQNGHNSAKTVLLELIQSLSKDYCKEKPRTKRRLADVLWDLQGYDLKDVNRADVALALVRARRELDPGVQRSLALVEALDARGATEAKQVREMLLRFHHIRQVLELAEYEVCRGGLLPRDHRLLDSLVAARWEAQSFKGGIYADLYDFCARMEMRKVPGVSELGDLKKAISSAVDSSYTTGSAFQHAHGLSVYFPVAARDYTPKYMNLQFSRDTGWGRLVRAYLEATRKARRDEDTMWFGEQAVRRYGTSEVDPLRREEIEASIVGIDGLETRKDWADYQGKAGDETRAKAGDETRAKAGDETRAKAGDETRAKAGDETRAKAGDETRSKAGDETRSKAGDETRGKGKASAVYGNGPDGFRRID